MIGRIARAALPLLAALGVSSPALARPVTDCPLRDAPFSAGLPVIDLMLSDAARAVLDRHSGGRMSRAPDRFMGTRPPTFAAILTLREAARFAGMTQEQVAAADADLRKLPVTAADRAARCARYDNDVPAFDLPPGKPRVLLFEKINGFKDEPSVNAAHAAFLAQARRKGWTIVATDKAGVFNPRSLRQFDVVVWNNISGDVLTLRQRRAFEDYVTRGGAFVGVHGSAGDFVYFWDWYVDTLIGARFIGHPMAQQFQEARVVVEARDDGFARALPAEWRMTDEWYSFRASPRGTGATVIATLDEVSYKPDGMMGQDLRMGDHPIAWRRCVGRGRSFYSAIGHRAEVYSEPHHVALLDAAMDWAVTEKQACAAPRR